MTTTTYTCRGSVRGSCGIKHRIATAAQCCAADQRDCRKAGGYSDRHPERSSGEPLSEDEYDVLMYELGIAGWPC